MEAAVIDGAGSVSTSSNASPTIGGSGPTSSTPSVSTLISDNSNKFGLDARSLAADLSGLSPAEQQATLADLSRELTPVQQGELQRALDDQNNTGIAGLVDAGLAAVGAAASAIASAAVTVATNAVDAAKKAAEAAKVPDPMGISKILGADAAKLAALSPSLTADMQALEKAGWTVQVGTAGGGTFADRTTKTITVDQNEIGNPAALVQSLAHEVGHARYTPAIDTSSKAAYLKSALADEGAATLSNIRAQREIIANGGADIGIAGNPANQKDYNAAYDAYVKSGDAAAARDTIGAIYGAGEHTSTTGQTYNDYYGGWYDKNFPATK
jgi:hypothetical protein